MLSIWLPYGLCYCFIYDFSPHFKSAQVLHSVPVDSRRGIVRVEVDGVRLEHFMSAQHAQHLVELHLFRRLAIPDVVDDIRDLEVFGRQETLIANIEGITRGRSHSPVAEVFKDLPRSDTEQQQAYHQGDWSVDFSLKIPDEGQNIYSLYIIIIIYVIIIIIMDSKFANYFKFEEIKNQGAHIPTNV